MKKTVPFAIGALLLQVCAVDAAVEASGEPEIDTKPQYLQVSVDRVVVDTGGLMQAADKLAASIDRLAVSIERLSTDSEALSDEDRALLMSAVQSVDAAGKSLRELAQELPRAVDGFGERLPQAIRDSGQPIADLSGSLRSVSESLQLITDSLPQATENAKSLVNATLDAAVLRLSIYTFVLFAALALALIAVVWFIYRQYLGPLVRRLDQIAGGPEQLEATARHMRHTSANLLQLERQASRGDKPPGAD